MRSTIIGIVFLFLAYTPVFAQSASSSATPSGTIKGIYDEELVNEATPTASPSATPRAVTYLDTSNTPTSGAVENTIALLIGGCALIFLGIRYSRT